MADNRDHINNRVPSSARPASDDHANGPRMSDADGFAGLSVIVLGEDRPEARKIAAAIAPRVARVEVRGLARETDAAREIERYDLAIIDLGEGDPAKDGPAFELCSRLVASAPGISVVVLRDSPRLQDAIDALRSGAVDLLPRRLPADELARRLGESVTRGRLLRNHGTRTDQLTRLRADLDTARRRLVGAVGNLTHELRAAASGHHDGGLPHDPGDDPLGGALEPTAAPPSVPAQACRAQGASSAMRLDTALRDELDLEQALRIVLEWVHAETGTTNAAVFLRGGDGDWSLGAYINHDLPAESAEVLMEELSAAVGPAVEDRDGLVAIDPAEADHGPGEAPDPGADADPVRPLPWLDDQSLLAAPGRCDGECRAVVTVFRHATCPFGEPAADVLLVAARLFAKRLDVIMRVHHRLERLGLTDDFV